MVVAYRKGMWTTQRKGVLTYTTRMIRVEISTMAYCHNTHRSFASILVWWTSIVDGHCSSSWCRSSSPSHLKRGADKSWRRCHCGGLHLNLWRKRSSLLAGTLRYQHMTNRRWPGVYKHICQPAYKDPATAFAGSDGVSFKTQITHITLLCDPPICVLSVVFVLNRYM